MNRKYWLIILMTIYTAFLGMNKLKAQDQEVKQLLLDVEKLAQFKKILSDMKSAYTVVMRGYTTVRDISKGDFNLHKVFLDGLMAVSPVVRNYKKTADIVSMQLNTLREYKAAFNRFKASNMFQPDEVLYIGRVYNNLLDASLKNLSDLTTVVTAGRLRMSDAERLSVIDRLYDDSLDKLSFLRSFNNNTSVLALQRRRQLREVRTVEGLYGRSNP
ncbi:TerB family tellurite resistance protein [Arachidicoccus terrestris]|nr:TerB family tellurite resistance protein [Arachidicoccus terrestris]